MYSLQQLINHSPQLTVGDGEYLNNNQNLLIFEIEEGGNPNHNFEIVIEAQSLVALTSVQVDEYIEAFTLGNPNPKRRVRKS